MYIYIYSENTIVNDILLLHYIGQIIEGIRSCFNNNILILVPRPLVRFVGVFHVASNFAEGFYRR